MSIVISMIPNIDSVFKNNYVVDLTFSDAYNPYINYNWSTTTSSTKRYLVDDGDLGLNAEMFTGQGIYFNGTNQKINTLTYFNNNAASRMYTKNGLTVYEEAPLSDVYPTEGNYQNLIYFNTTISADLQNNFTNSPELFIYKDEDGIIKSDLGLDINTVLEWFPLCELDNYIRAMKSYNEVEKYNPSNVVISGNNANNSWTDNLDGSYTLSQADFTSTALLDTGVYLSFGQRYIIDADVSDYLNGALTGDNVVVQTIFNSNGKKYRAITCISGGNLILKANVRPTNLTIKINSIKEITAGIYSITNYNIACITNAQKLPYGLQTAKIKRNSLGMYLSSSKWLECDGIGYIEIPISNRITSIEINVNPQNNTGNVLSGSATLSASGLELFENNTIIIPKALKEGTIKIGDAGFIGEVKLYNEAL